MKILFLCSIYFFSYIVFGRSGRTDANGCHYDRQNGGYHCHNIKNRKNASSEKESVDDRKNFKYVKYIKNYDADTITFDIPNVHPLISNNIPVRVSKIDAPEIKTQDKCEKNLAIKGKNRVEELLKNAKKIDLQNVQRGKYFRIVADVILDGKSLGELLLKEKLAYSYDGKSKRKIDWCKYY